MFGSRPRAVAELAPKKPAVAISDLKAASLRDRIAPTGPPQPPLSEEARRRAAAALHLSASFAQIVTVLMRSAQHKHLALGDLEWLVLPPLTAGQLAIANVQTKEGGASAPAAVVLWACVSPEVDRKLSENLSTPMRLRPDEWKSGEILWLIEAVGDQRVVASVLKQLSETTFKGREMKLRARGKDGKKAVSTLKAQLAAAGAAAI